MRILWGEGLFNKEFGVYEKTIYNWIQAGGIPNMTKKDLPRGGRLKRGKKGGGLKRRRSNADFAFLSIENRPEEADARREPGREMPAKAFGRECKADLDIINKLGMA